MRNASREMRIGLIVGLMLGALLIGAAVALSIFPPPRRLNSSQILPTRIVTMAPSAIPVMPDGFAVPIPLGLSAAPTYVAPFGASIFIPLRPQILTMTGSERTAEVPVDYDPENAPKPFPGQEYLVVDFLMQCDTFAEEPCVIDFDEFGLRSAEGIEYGGPLFPAHFDLDDMFRFMTIQPGETQAGTVVFIIQMEDTELFLTYPRAAPPDEQISFDITE